jgi:hypothetical protein
MNRQLATGNTPREPRGLSRRARLGTVAAIVAFSVFGGAAGGWAYWTAQATATVGTGAASLTITSTGFAASTLNNDTIAVAGSTVLQTTGSITFTNTTSTTSTQSQTLQAVFSRASGTQALAQSTTVTVWESASAAACTNTAAVGVGSVTGTWDGGVTVSKSLAIGASVVYCIRNSGERQTFASATSPRSFVPQAVATLTIANFTTSNTSSSTVTEQFVYPLATISSALWNYVVRATTTWCWDVSASGTTTGSLMISYACKNNTDLNQDWRWIDGDGDGYGNFQARHAPAIRVDAGTSTTSGSAVTMITADAASASQQWQPQLVAAGTYQFVNKNSGLCLSMPATSTGAATQVTCSGGADQRFTLTQRSVIPLTTFTCANSGNNASRTVQYSWTSDWSGGPYTIQSRQTTAGAWVSLGTTAGASYAVGPPVGAPFTAWGTGTYDVQILNSTGLAVGTDTLTISFSVGGAYYYARC